MPEDDQHPSAQTTETDASSGGARDRPALGTWWTAFWPPAWPIRGSGQGAAEDPAEVCGELVRRSWEIGAGAVDRQVRQGQRAIQEVGSGSYGPASMSRDILESAQSQMRLGLEMASLWADWLSGPAALAWPWQCSGAADGKPQPPDRGTPEDPDDHAPEQANGLARLQAEHDVLARRLQELERQVAERVVTRDLLDAELDKRLRDSAAPSVSDPIATLEALTTLREDLEAELMAGDLYRALLSSAPGLKKVKRPTPSEQKQTTVNIKAEIKAARRRGNLEDAIKSLVDRYWPKTRAVIERHDGPQWEVLRDQLFQGILDRDWRRARDYTGKYDEDLKPGKNRQRRVAEIVCSLVGTPEYRDKLKTRVDERLLGLWLEQLGGTAPAGQG